MREPADGPDAEVSRPWTTVAAWVLTGVIALAWVVLWLVQANWSGAETDPTLGTHMGTAAMAFPLELASTLLIALPVGLAGMWLGRRFLTAMLIGSAVLIAGCTAAFFALDMEACTWRNVDMGNVNLWGFIFLALLLGAAVAAGWHLGRQGRWGELAGCGLFLTSVALVIAEVQGGQCDNASVAVVREFEAIFEAIVVGVIWIVVASGIFLIGRRRRVPTAPSARS